MHFRNAVLLLLRISSAHRKEDTPKTKNIRIFRAFLYQTLVINHFHTQPIRTVQIFSSHPVFYEYRFLKSKQRTCVQQRLYSVLSIELCLGRGIDKMRVRTNSCGRKGKTRIRLAIRSNVFRSLTRQSEMRTSFKRSAGHIRI